MECFIITFPTDGYLSLPWAISTHSTPPRYLLEIHFNIIIPSTPRSSKWPFPPWSCLLCSLLHYPITASLLGPFNFLSTLFSNPYGPRSSLNAREEVLLPYTETDKIIVQYILIFILYGQQTGRQNILFRIEAEFPESKLLLICSWMKYWFLRAVPKYLTFATLSKHLLATFMFWNFLHSLH